MSVPHRPPRVRHSALIAVLIRALLASTGHAAAPPATTQSLPSSPDPAFAVRAQLFADDFQNGLDQWSTELERGGKVSTGANGLDIDVPAGCTVWFKPKLEGPVLIEYEATLVSAGGPNDRVSDLNCFWMARDARSPDNLFATKRSGKFSDYDRLLTYYVGQGGNGNTTTRFRRYIGEQDNRPLLPEHDLHDRRDLLSPNVSQRIQIIAAGSVVRYYRDGVRVFDFKDDKPYTSGWFGLRTTKNHMIVQHFRAYKVTSAATTDPREPGH